MSHELDGQTPFVPTALDPAAEEKNAKTVIARMSGQERCYFVYAKIYGQGGAVARVFLGSVPVLPKAELAIECQRQWPRQYKDGLKLVLNY